jgi:hypothetical protein
MARTPAPTRKAKPVGKPPGEPFALSLKLPSGLVSEIDAIATEERRTRVGMIEVFLRQSVQAYRQKAAVE